LRVTIRNPDPEMLRLLRETARDNHMTLGECFNDAISTWYERLPELSPEIEESGTLANSYSF